MVPDAPTSRGRALILHESRRGGYRSRPCRLVLPPRTRVREAVHGVQGDNLIDFFQRLADRATLLRLPRQGPDELLRRLRRCHAGRRHNDRQGPHHCGVVGRRMRGPFFRNGRQLTAGELLRDRMNARAYKGPLSTPNANLQLNRPAPAVRQVRATIPIDGTALDALLWLLRVCRAERGVVTRSGRPSRNRREMA